MKKVEKVEILNRNGVKLLHFKGSSMDSIKLKPLKIRKLSKNSFNFYFNNVLHSVYYIGPKDIDIEETIISEFYN